jgi:hypothetical protein
MCLREEKSFLDVSLATAQNIRERLLLQSREQDISLLCLTLWNKSEFSDVRETLHGSAGSFFNERERPGSVRDSEPTSFSFENIYPVFSPLVIRLLLACQFIELAKYFFICIISSDF